ncbi:hypothetical protein PG996_009051 [Apiospora saccharicola]|uniref:Zn(2)-C6 fungal-type domain-containing protein n=1 Tax=Apiospora saccharicola TaxID=335842 RepID=A0ABR1UM12_9PEZI
MPKVAATTKRSACDRCRAKRVRCPRAEDSIAPCPRCIRVGEPCVTGSPGRPGRPRKSPLDGVIIPNGPVVGSGDDSSLESLSTPQDGGDVEAYDTPSVQDEPLSANTSTAWLGADTLDRWTVPGDPNFFGAISTTTGSSRSGKFPSLDHLNNPSQPQGLLGAADNLDMMYSTEGSNDMLDVDPFLASFVCFSDAPPAPAPSAASSLRNLGEKLERQALAAKALFSDPRNIVEKCPEDGSFEGMASENPVAVALACTSELIEIVQSLTLGNGPDSHSSDVANAHGQRLLPGVPASSTRDPPISTETTLLVLSSYVALMRLYGSIFRHAHQSLSQTPPATIRSLKAKAVLRMGDIPAKVYAMGIIEVIRSHIQRLESCLELPATYRLSGEVTSSPQQCSKGIFAGGGRAKLLQSVMAQEDLQSEGGTKSFIEGIQENMAKTIALFDG